MDFLGGVVAFVSIVGASVVAGLLIRRVLGVAVSLVRATFAALLASVLVLPVLNTLVETPQPDQGSADRAMWLYLCLVVVFGVVLAMLLLAIAEMLVPDGSLPGPVELWRSWRSRWARGRRYVQIVRILAGHGLSRFLRGRRPAGASTASERRDLARSLRLALEDGGVTFVKLGQQLSNRRDLLPPEFVDELSLLQDSARPLPWDEVRAAVERELGRPVEAAFLAIEPSPLGSASIAQVHGATLRDGTGVVIKVQRPGIASEVDRDLDIVARLAATLSSRTEWGARLGLNALADGFAQALREELDFRTELRSTELVAANLADASVRVPRTFPELSTAGLLVLERMPGTPLGSAEALLTHLGPELRREIADSLLDVVMRQVLTSGIFHVDLHPGNVLIDDDGTVSLLDLGSVGRLGDATREAMVRLFTAIGTGSSQSATDALLDLVDRPEDVDERALEQDVGEIILRFGGGGPGAGAAAFSALFRLVSEYGLGIPPAVAATFRAIATLEGTLLTADPGYDLSARVQAIGRDHTTEAMAPDRLRAAVERELVTLLPVVRRLPRRLDRLTDAAEHGRLSVGVRLLADRRDRDLVTTLWYQGLQTVLAATSGLIAALLFVAGPGPYVTPGIGVFWVLGAALLCISVILGLRVLMAVLRRSG